MREKKEQKKVLFQINKEGGGRGRPGQAQRGPARRQRRPALERGISEKEALEENPGQQGAPRGPAQSAPTLSPADAAVCRDSTSRELGGGGGELSALLHRCHSGGTAAS